MISRRSRSPRLGRHVDNEGSYHTNVNSGPHPDDISRPESDFTNYQEFENSTLPVEGSIVLGECHDAMQSSAEMKCPLCRGSVSGWIPAGDVRQYLDNKLRTCSHDSCKFTGNYEQLREHARTAHVLTKPAHVDLSRKRTWDRLEREQEVGDVISAIRSQVPGVIIVGDYVIETRDDMSPDIDSGDESSEWYSDHVESPDNIFDSPRVWPNEVLGSPSIWSDERHSATSQQSALTIRHQQAAVTVGDPCIQVGRGVVGQAHGVYCNGASQITTLDTAATIADIITCFWIGPMLVPEIQGLAGA
ncbi:unnamed protein product [Miscanthus lutarioriparius]|uniref:Uncharacterized protein n=1 Tax=Miscanthus lutarioriparius TaxID=422564 RepID=A0A811NRZ0_9POAL|nr:unnamed protein product [Miscanthus lutarioriparius]